MRTFQPLQFLLQICALVRNLWALLSQIAANSVPRRIVHPQVRIQRRDHLPGHTDTTHKLVVNC